MIHKLHLNVLFNLEMEPNVELLQHSYSLNILNWSWSFLFILPVKYEFIAVLVAKLSGMDKNDQE
jgi:hypothetical protein